MDSQRLAVSSSQTRFRVMLITDRAASRRPLLETIEDALQGGATGVILREKDLSARDLHHLAVQILPLTRRADALLIVHDRLDVALAAGADGAHLGWQSLPLASARALLGQNCLLGVSTHHSEEARQAEAGGADYVIFGPVFPTPSKAGLIAVQGLEGIRSARAAVRIPLVGVGGIDTSNAASVFKAGADGVAIIRALHQAEDAESAARALRMAF